MLLQVGDKCFKRLEDRHPALLMAYQPCYNCIITLHWDFPAYLHIIHTVIPDTLASNSITDVF